MKFKISNLLIASAAPLVVYSIYKYYKVNYIENDVEDEFKEEPITLNAEILKHIACQTDNIEKDSDTLSPGSSKKNSIVSSRTSSIVDLTELERQTQNQALSSSLKSALTKNIINSQVKTPIRSGNNFEEDAHFVESDINYNSNKNNEKGYFSYVKKWFGS